MKKWTDAALDKISAIARVKATPAMLHSTWCRVSLKNVGDLRAPVGWMQAAATQAMLGHRRGAAAQQTARRRRKALTFLSETRHQAATAPAPSAPPSSPSWP